MTEGTPSDSARELTDEIERTREELGETVAALAAKADVKARAKGMAAQAAGRITDAAGQVREQAASKAGQVKEQAASKAGQVRKQAVVTARQVRGDAADQVDTESVRRSARRAIESAQQRRVQLTVAAAVLLAGWLILRWRRR